MHGIIRLHMTQHIPGASWCHGSMCGSVTSVMPWPCAWPPRAKWFWLWTYFSFLYFLKWRRYQRLLWFTCHGNEQTSISYFPEETTWKEILISILLVLQVIRNASVRLSLRLGDRIPSFTAREWHAFFFSDISSLHLYTRSTRVLE